MDDTFHIDRVPVPDAPTPTTPQETPMTPTTPATPPSPQTPPAPEAPDVAPTPATPEPPTQPAEPPTPPMPPTPEDLGDEVDLGDLDTPDLQSPDTDSLSRTIMRLGRLLMRHEHITRSGRHGRSARIGQGRVLALLALREPLGQKDLAYLLGVRPQSLSELLGKLEHAGLVSRERDENDRRSTLVSLTAEGRGAAEEAARSGADEDDPFDVLDDTERAEFARLAGKVSQALITSDGEPGPHGPRRGRPRRGDGPDRGEDRGRRGRGPRWEGSPRWDGPRGDAPWGRPEDSDERRGRRERRWDEGERSDRSRARGGRRHGWGRDRLGFGGPAWA